MQERVLPHNIEAEQSVIGSMFLSKYAINRATEELYPELFYLDSHAKMFEVIKELADQKNPIDLTTVIEALNSKKYLDKIGGVEYLTEVVNSVPSAANVDYYIEIVRDKAILRRLIDVSTEITTASYDGNDTTNEILDEAEKKILNVIKNRKASEFKSIAQVVTNAQSILEELSKNEGNITGLETGFTDFDNLTSGLHGSEFIVLAARPAMGKTAFALNLATNIAINSGKTVALFNLEMSAEQLAMRMISSIGQIEGNKIRTGNFDAKDWEGVNEAVRALADAKMYIDDTPGITASEIRAKCRRLASSDEGLGIVIIDYLQLLTGSARYAGNRQQEVSEISRLLKTMALELNVPVIALAQLSRAVELRDDKRPIMSDLRESGSIEQDADIVGFLYRDDYYNKKAAIHPDISLSELIIAKHRNGATDTIELLFKRNVSTFTNYKKEVDEEDINE
ncbi:MAG: replicative DNA helicase [Bacilli bacterium]|nr:replicative DNA helicase [Bacilli bacterium]